jgi:hypothetical protein
MVEGVWARPAIDCASTSAASVRFRMPGWMDQQGGGLSGKYN